MIFFIILCLLFCPYTDKKENKVSSHIRKFRRERLQSHMWLTASSNMTKYLRISSYCILGSPSSYMTLQPLRSKFPYIWGKINFLFYHCRDVAITFTKMTKNCKSYIKYLRPSCESRGCHMRPLYRPRLLLHQMNLEYTNILTLSSNFGIFTWSFSLRKTKHLP